MLNMGSEGVDQYVDLITYVKDRPGHDLRYAIDAAKIEAELGWKNNTFHHLSFFT